MTMLISISSFMLVFIGYEFGIDNKCSRSRPDKALLAWALEQQHSHATSRQWEGRARLVLAALTVVLGTAAANAQTWPNKPMRVLTVEAGGALDITLRTVTQAMSPALGQPFLVENRPSNTRPEQVILKSAPDGYTLLYWANPFWLSPFLQEVNYDPLRDFTPISLVARAPGVLVANAALPIKTVQDLVQMAKARPGSLNYAATSNGSSPHLAVVLFNTLAGIDVQQIFYKGTVQGVNDVIAGRVQYMIPSVASTLSQIKAGKLRALAITSTDASELLPGVPPVAATFPEYESLSLHALFAPAGTSPTIVGRLHQELVKALASPEVKARLFNIAVEPVGSTPEQLVAVVRSEMAKTGKLIKDKGIRAE